MGEAVMAEAMAERRRRRRRRLRWQEAVVAGPSPAGEAATMAAAVS